MKIGIIGGGSIGLLLGAYYGIDHEVTIFTNRKEQADSIKSKGIQLVSQRGESIAKVHSTNETNELNDQDFIFIAVKQYDIKQVLTTLSMLSEAVSLCFVQNGMGHIDALHTLPQQKICIGTVEHGAARLDDRTVSHNGIGKTNVAIFRGNSHILKDFPTTAHAASFPIAHHQNFEEMLLGKLLANAVINPLTAIFNVKNGELISNPFFYQVFRTLYNETVNVFPSLQNDNSFSEIKNICMNTKNNTSSMLKDIQEGKQTEVDAILGYILKTAEAKDIHVPTIQTVNTMVKGIEYKGGFKQ